MREKLIEKLVATAGIDAAKATALYALFCAKVYGDEPTEAQLAQLTEGDLADLPAGIRRTVWTAVTALRPKSEEVPKAKRFKLAKASDYTPRELAGFAAEDPKGSAEGLRALIGDEPFRFLVDGKLDLEATAERIRALRAGSPVASFVVIGGKEVSPVGWELDEAVEDHEDPFQRGAALGQPGDVSELLGVSLTGIAHEVRQAIDCARQYPHELAGASLRELQGVAAGAKRLATPDDLLAEMPKARRAWGSGWKRRELKVPRRAALPFAEPTASYLAPRGGYEAPSADPSGMTVHEALVALGLERGPLLAGLHPAFVSSLERAASPSAQYMMDLAALFAAKMADGSDPLATYLSNALRLAGPRREAAVFRSALAARSTTAKAPPLIHIVAAAEDTRLAESFRKHFAPAVRSGRARVVVNGDLCAGAHVFKEREASVRAASVVVFLATTDALAEFDVADLIRSHPRVIPVLARPCRLEHTGFAGKVVLPRFGGVANTEEKWSEVATELLGLVERIVR